MGFRDLEIFIEPEERAAIERFIDYLEVLLEGVFVMHQHSPRVVQRAAQQAQGE